LKACASLSENAQLCTANEAALRSISPAKKSGALFQPNNKSFEDIFSAESGAPWSNLRKLVAPKLVVPPQPRASSLPQAAATIPRDCPRDQ